MNDTKLAIITPLVMLVIVIAFAQTFIVPYWTADRKSPFPAGPGIANLQMVGYNYNKDLASISVTLWDKSTSPVEVTGVSYDGTALIKGAVGSPTDLTNSSGVSEDDLVFPAANHWNMFTEGPSTPLIEPSALVTFYLGVGPALPGSVHTIIVASGTLNYVFQVQK